MQNLFIEDDDVIEIKFSVATDKDGTIFCDLDKGRLVSGLKEINAEMADFEIKEYTVIFKKPSFGDSMGLYESVFTTDGQNVSFNPIAARFRKIILLIKKWDLSGEMKKPTEKEVQKLHPVIATVIGNKLDDEVGGLLS